MVAFDADPSLTEARLDLSLSRIDCRTHPTAALLAAGIAVLAVVLFGQLPNEGRWTTDVADSAHGPAFAIVALIVIALRRRASTHRTTITGDYSLGLMIAVLLGALVELLQGAIGRDASYVDLSRDALGALAGTGFLSLVDPRVQALPSRRSLRFAGLLVGVVATAIVIAPVVISASAYVQRQRNFPTLVDFSSRLSTYFFDVYSAVAVEREALPSDVFGGRQNTIGLHARFAGNKDWWGLALWETCPDWRAYDRLAIDLANPTNNPLSLRISIRDRRQLHDSHGAGYVGNIEIAPRSRQTWTVPLESLRTAEGSKHVDTANVNSIFLGRNRENRAEELYVIRMWLE